MDQKKKKKTIKNVETNKYNGTIFYFDFYDSHHLNTESYGYRNITIN